METALLEENNAQEEFILLWRQKKELDRLEKLSGQHTSLISLLLPPDTQIPKVTKMLTQELGTASCIKSRLNRLSVIDGLKSIQHRMNGLAIFCGVIMEDSKPRKIITMLEPIKSIPNFVYRCDSKFYLDSLKEMLDVTRKYGFIVVDGNGALFASLAGSTQTILARYGVTLPKKHRKGGQSSVRFSRLREEARHNYLTKINEMAIKCFIGEENKLNVEGIVLAGSADFKDQLSKNRLDPRLQSHVIAIIDVSYGFNQGLNQAIELSSGILKDVQLIKQKKILAKYFEEISLDTGKYCFGYKDTLMALESGAVQTLLVHDKLDIVRYEASNGQVSKILFGKGEKEPKELADEKLEIVESTLLVDWLAEHYRDFGCRLEIIMDSSAEGSQFCKGFGGIGGVLRYQVSFESEEVEQENFEGDEEDELAEYFSENGKEEEDIGF